MPDFAPVDIGKLLVALDIDAQKRGTKWIAKCPAPNHQDRHPSWMIRDDPGGKWHGSHVCQSCGLTGGTWELVAVVRGVSLGEAQAFVNALGGVVPLSRDVPLVSVKIRRRRIYELPPGVVIPESFAHWQSAPLRYIQRRGITEDQVMRWGIGYATTGPLAWRIVMPVYTSGRLVAYVARSIFDDGSLRYDMPSRQAGARPDFALWGEAGFDAKRGAITVAEGVFSALALERVGAPNPCALAGSELTVYKLALLAKWPVVLVATDPDAAGDKAARKLAMGLRRCSWVERVELDHSPDDSDPNRLRRAVQRASGGFQNVVVS